MNASTTQAVNEIASTTGAMFTELIPFFYLLVGAFFVIIVFTFITKSAKFRF